MQAKIIDFASDKITKSLQKIEQNDVKNAFNSIGSKFRSMKSSANKTVIVSANEKYGDSMKFEDNFPQTKKSDEPEKLILTESSEYSSADGISKFSLKVDNMYNEA